MHHSNCPSIHPFCRGLPFQPMGWRENTWKQKSAHKKKSTPFHKLPRFHANNGTNIHQNENQQERPQQSAQTSGKSQHTKSQCRFVDCNLWFWGEYLRDVKAYVADGLQPERQIGSFPKIGLKLLKLMIQLLSSLWWTMERPPMVWNLVSRRWLNFDASRNYKGMTLDLKFVGRQLMSKYI